MPKRFHPRCGARKTAPVWLQGKCGDPYAGEAAVLLPKKEGETNDTPAAYRARCARR
jgi:hypothetical protein